MRTTQRDQILAQVTSAAKRQASLAEDEPAEVAEPSASTPPEPEAPLASNGAEPQAPEEVANPLAALDGRRSRGDELVHMAFRLPRDLRDAVHRRCLEYDVTVQEFGRLAVELLLGEIDRRGAQH